MLSPLNYERVELRQFYGTMVSCEHAPHAKESSTHLADIRIVLRAGPARPKNSVLAETSCKRTLPSALSVPHPELESLTTTGAVGQPTIKKAIL